MADTALPEAIRIDIRPAFAVMNPFHTSQHYGDEETNEYTIKDGMTWVCEQFVLELNKLDTIENDLNGKAHGNSKSEFYTGAKYAIEFLQKENPLGEW